MCYPCPRTLVTLDSGLYIPPGEREFSPSYLMGVRTGVKGGGQDGRETSKLIPRCQLNELLRRSNPKSEYRNPKQYLNSNIK